MWILYCSTAVEAGKCDFVFSYSSWAFLPLGEIFQLQPNTQMESCDLATIADAATTITTTTTAAAALVVLRTNVGAHRLKSLTNAIYQEQLSSSHIWRICLTHASISVHNISSQTFYTCDCKNCVWVFCGIIYIKSKAQALEVQLPRIQHGYYKRFRIH